MLVQTIDEFEDFIRVLERSHPIFFADLETTGLNPWHGDRLVGLAFLFLEEDNFDTPIESFYLPFRHREGNLPFRLLYELFPLFTNPSRTWANQNTKFDIHTIEQEGVRVFNKYVDLIQIAHLANENEPSYSLDNLSRRYLKEEGGKFEEEVEAWAREHLGPVNWKERMADIPPSVLCKYAEGDTIQTHRTLLNRLAALEAEGLSYLVEDICEYGDIGRRMERNGVGVDPRLTNVLMHRAGKNAARLSQEMFKMIGREFNPGSPRQLEKVLFDELNLPVIRESVGAKTERVSRSTNKEVLEDLTSMTGHPFMGLLTEFRQWQTAENNYFRKFLRMMDRDHRLHPNLSMTGTETSRLSCREPPLQGLPRETDVYNVRQAICARHGNVLISIDYSQIELRILAYYTQDPNLLSAYRGGADIHTQTAEATGLDRNAAPGAKTLNFSAVYGIGVPGVMRKFHRSEQEAQALLDAFHGQYPGIRRLRRKCQAAAERDGFIEMWTGRRRRYNSPFAEPHKAMSNLIQGGVAELMRVAMTKLDRLLRGTRVEMLLQVHDDIIFECPETEVDFWVPILQSTMQNFLFMLPDKPESQVPIVAEPKYGKSWGKMTKWTPPVVEPDPFSIDLEIPIDDFFDQLVEAKNGTT